LCIIRSTQGVASVAAKESSWVDLIFEGAQFVYHGVTPRAPA
jgi:hypothetical protein